MAEETKMSVGDGKGEEEVKVILFYRYHDIDDEAMIEWHKDHCARLGLLGRVLIAKEGINGTLAGPPLAIDEYIALMRAKPGFEDVDWKTSTASSQPFPDLFIKPVPEIINTGNLIPADFSNAGVHLPPKEFHKKLSELLNKKEEGKDFVLLDVRNYFEYDIGHFDGAIHPEMKAFSQYPQYIEKHLDQFENKPVMMYCTGGIRCEKASAFLKAKGVDEVYQLKGGIHRYLEQFPDGGLWAGKNFVFDKRVAMAPEEQPKDRAVVGTCLECAVPYDELSGDRVCTVCRGPVLICPACNDKLWELHCTTHQHLKRCYFTDLSPFSEEELKAQRKELQVLHTELLQ
ncbi:Tstd2, partial [Symbiodinium sp. KB8]